MVQIKWRAAGAQAEHGSVCPTAGKRRGPSTSRVVGCFTEMKSHRRSQQDVHSERLTYSQGFYLFDSSNQVLDKKPPEVVERLQLSALREVKEGERAQRKNTQCAGIKRSVYPT